MRRNAKNLVEAGMLTCAVFVFGVSCIRRAPAGLLDPRTAPTNSSTATFTQSFTRTFTPLPITNTFTYTVVPPTLSFTPTYTYSYTYSYTFTYSPTPPAGSTNTFTPTPVPPTNTFTRTFTYTYTPTTAATATFTPTTPALGPYIVRGESAFSWAVSPPSWATMAYPMAEMVRSAPPYTTWTAPAGSDAVMYGGYNGNAGSGPSWCTPFTTFTTFQVKQDTSDKHSGSGSLKFSGQQGGYSWGGWTYWGLTVNGSWSQVSMDPFLTGLEFWAKDLQPNGHTSSIRLGLRSTDVDDGTGGTDWAKDQALSPSWTQYQHAFLSMDSGYPSFTPITNFTATGPTLFGGLAGSGAGAACTWAYLLDDVKLY